MSKCHQHKHTSCCFSIKNTCRYRWFTISINVCLQPNIHYEYWCLVLLGSWCIFRVTKLWTFSCLDCVPASSSWRGIEKKVAGFVSRNNFAQNAVPIARRNAKNPLDKNKTVNAKCNQFPLLAANALTIRKDQGGTVKEVVHHYKRGHSNKLVCVALSQVTNLEGLHIVPENNVKRFYHGLIEPHHTTDLDLKRLRQNHYATIVDIVADFMLKSKGFPVFSFNCQSLRSHFNDLNNQITQRTNILILSETWLENEQEQSIPNFNCIVKYKPPNVRGGGMAIYHKINDKSNVVTPHMEISIREVDSLSVDIFQLENCVLLNVVYKMAIRY